MVIGDIQYEAFDAHMSAYNLPVDPGRLLYKKEGAVLVSTINGSIWISHLRKSTVKYRGDSFKLPATMALPPQLTENLKELDATLLEKPNEYQIAYIEETIPGDVVTIHFNFYNGAMSTY